MTVGYYLNFEIVIKQIVESEIANMSDSNVMPLWQDERPDNLMILDGEAFENNFSHGAVALLFIVTYMEATLNSVIRENDYTEHPYNPNVDETVRENRLSSDLGKSIDDKVKKVLNIRFEKGTQEFALWDSFKRVLDVRDALVHYKKNYIQDSLVPDPRMWVVGKREPLVPPPRSRDDQFSVGHIFTRSKMSELWNDIQELVEYIVDQSGCIITPGVGLVQSDGKDGFASYVVNRELYVRQYPDIAK